MKKQHSQKFIHIFINDENNKLKKCLCVCKICNGYRNTMN